MCTFVSNISPYFTFQKTNKQTKTKNNPKTGMFFAVKTITKNTYSLISSLQHSSLDFFLFLYMMGDRDTAEEVLQKQIMPYSTTQ